jgi:hypothetical protein
MLRGTNIISKGLIKEVKGRKLKVNFRERRPI